MLPRRLAIPPRFLLLVLLICTVYWLVTARTGFSPLAAESTFDHRLGECAALWIILCSGYIGVMMLSRRPYPEGGRTWPIILVPLLVGLWKTTCLLRDHWADLSHPILGSSPSFRVHHIVWMVVPAAVGAIGVAVVLILARAWRRVRGPGTCYSCGYNLQGNTSNRCPECGLQIGGDEPRQWSFFRSCPEVLLFETAAERDAAWRESHRRMHRRWYWRALPGLIGLGVLLTPEAGWFDRYAANTSLYLGGGLAAFLTGVLLIWVSVYLVTRFQRRILRQILIERGIRVCLQCGQDLRVVKGDVCPNCRRKQP